MGLAWAQALASNTPIMIITGANDFRIPYTESLQAFNAGVLLILAPPTPFGWLLAAEQAPQTLARLFAFIAHPWQLLLAINVLLLILGCFMEAVTVLIILSPVLAPIVAAAGINETHFGVVLVLNLMIGTVTPPVGVLMYIVCRIAKVSIVEFAREAFVPTVGLIVVLFLITYIPSLVTWLPSLIWGN